MGRARRHSTRGEGDREGRGPGCCACVSPPAARHGVGTALIKLAETHIAQRGHHFVVLESSLNAVGFYLRLGYTPAATQCSSAAVAMRKQVAG
ncbi:MAG: GNAT family N-acetyltransferase [Betaproteobacteria bacterium]|nr:MAG: GNAT family N-acetyltransferase [Betaproteobacteria bacterium]